MQHVVMFSGGIGSYAAARRVVESGIEDLVLLFCDTRMEDASLYRFLREASRDVGGRLVWLQDGRTPWQVFYERRYLGNSRIDPCSYFLKRKLAKDWMDSNVGYGTIYLGMDWTEEHRIERARRYWYPVKVEAPMAVPPYLLKEEMLAIATSRGIALPRLYELGFPHNNCGGFCVKAGQAHFRHLLNKLPERYMFHEGMEQAMRRYLERDVSMLRETKDGVRYNLTLRELRARLPEECDPYDWGGCGCFTDG